MPEYTIALTLPQYRARGSFLYHGQPIEYAGFLYLDEDTQKFQGPTLDGRANCRVLSCEGAFEHLDGEIVLEFRRQAVQSHFLQNTLSDPMIFRLSKKDDGKIAGAYRGAWKFAERCYNINISIDESGEKAPVFHDDTNTTGEVNLTLEEIL